MVMNENRRCSILFHLLVPGGKWQTVTGSLSSSASFWSSTFHSRTTITVAAAAVGCDHQAVGFGMAFLTHRPPPPADRIDGKAGGIVIGADADPSDIVVDVVDSVRHGAAQFGIDKIMNIDRFRGAFAMPFPAIVLEIAHQFLLFGVNRYHRLIRGQERHGPAY